MALDWFDFARSSLAVAGLKRGAARERVLSVLAQHSCALSAAEIEDVLRRRGEPTGTATIYRVLDLLVELGLVERVVVLGGQARFERMDPAGNHHHHLICDQCGELVPFADPSLERAISGLSDRLGVRVESHEVTLRGACGRCD